MNFKINTKKIVIAGLFLSVIACGSPNKQKESKEESKKEVAEAHVPFFKISLAQWSLHKEIFAGKLDPMDFAEKSSELGFGGIEYVSALYGPIIKEIGLDSVVSILNAKSKQFNVDNVLIMIDGEGPLGAADEATRKNSVERHYKWVDAAAKLGCHSVRVNASGDGTPEEHTKYVVAGLTALSKYAAGKGINVIVENHGGISSNGAWLANVMKEVGMDNCGTLPDFGNFCQTKGVGSINDERCDNPYDVYKGVSELMPYAKAVSAKSYDFDADGNQEHLDYARILQIVKDAGYTGYVGVEYEGETQDEIAGIIATKELLIKASKNLK